MHSTLHSISDRESGSALGLHAARLSRTLPVLDVDRLSQQQLEADSECYSEIFGASRC